MYELCEILFTEFLSALGAVKDSYWLGNVQNSATRISFSTCGSEIAKNKEEILKIQEFSGYLVWCKMHEFLSSVFNSCALSENLPGVLQKGSKFVYFWAEIHKLCVLLSVSHPLVANNFSAVEIHGFHL